MLSIPIYSKILKLSDFLDAIFTCGAAENMTLQIYKRFFNWESKIKASYCTISKQTCCKNSHNRSV